MNSNNKMQVRLIGGCLFGHLLLGVVLPIGYRRLRTPFRMVVPRGAAPGGQASLTFAENVYQLRTSGFVYYYFFFNLKTRLNFSSTADLEADNVLKFVSYDSLFNAVDFSLEADAFANSWAGSASVPRSTSTFALERACSREAFFQSLHHDGFFF